MCGLAGIVLFKNIDYKNEVTINEVNEATLDKMLNLISYRGPDASNKHRGENHIFGHNRLSIIDLNEASNQPMVSENRYVIVFNGEIYNFKNLKKLYEFK